MKNLKTILSEHGLEPSDFDAIEKDVLANYVTRVEFEQKTAKAKDADALQAKITDLEADKAAMQKTIDAYGEAKPEDIKKITDDYAALKKQMDDKTAADEAAKANQSFAEAMNEAVGDKKFANDLVKTATYAKVQELHEANPAKGLADLLEEVTKDTKGIWESDHQAANPLPKPGVGLTDTGDDSKLRAIMGLPIKEQ